MVARIWRGWTAADNADEVAAHLRDTTLERYLATPGHVSGHVLRRPLADGVELMTLSLWESAAAVPAGVGESHRLLVGRQTIAACWEVVETRPAVAAAA